MWRVSAVLCAVVVIWDPPARLAFVVLEVIRTRGGGFVVGQQEAEVRIIPHHNRSGKHEGHITAVGNRSVNGESFFIQTRNLGPGVVVIPVRQPVVAGAAVPVRAGAFENPDRESVVGERLIAVLVNGESGDPVAAARGFGQMEQLAPRVIAAPVLVEDPRKGGSGVVGGDDSRSRRDRGDDDGWRRPPNRLIVPLLFWK